MTTDYERLRRKHESLLKDVREWIKLAESAMDHQFKNDRRLADKDLWFLAQLLHTSTWNRED